jgi:phosphoribosylaminoimidazole-succinocarboxamide synthase
MSVNVQTLILPEFRELPLVIEGESKEVRYAGNGLVVIRFKPTIYSFTENRCATVEGSHIPRLRASQIFVDVLRKCGIRHAYREIGPEFILADLVLPHLVEFEKYGLPSFVPPDLTDDQITELPKAPPIEIIAKRYLTGTTKHGCVGMAGSHVRDSHPFYASMSLEGNGSLPEILIRFDWRNPLNQSGRGRRMAEQILAGVEELPVGLMNRIIEYGDRVADVALPSQLADLFIDVKQAQRTAFLTAQALEEFLASKNIVFYDLCMFIDEAGTMVYGEISPDCGRYRHLDLGSLDKDVWRTGGSSSDVIQKWNLLVQLLEDESPAGDHSNTGGE